MKTRSFLAIVAIFAAFPLLEAAEKQPAASVGDYPFWSSKKRGNVGQFVPGLNAVLQLTEAQRQQIAAARQEMSDDEAVKAARSISKSNPNVTAEQRDKARAAMEAATARLREKVAAILTPEQTELVGKIDAAYAAAVEDTGIVYADKFASVKADKAARQRIQQEKNADTEELFFHKLDALLTDGQRQIMDRAAEEEEQRAAAAPKKAAKQ